MLEPLFDAELDYQPAMAPLTSAGDGVLIGSGDGAQIRFEGRGYGTRTRQGDPAWRVAATLYLTTADSRYAWLDGALALWEGEFNEATGHARYTAYLQPAAPAA